MFLRASSVLHLPMLLHTNGATIQSHKDDFVVKNVASLGPESVNGHCSHIESVCCSVFQGKKMYASSSLL